MASIGILVLFVLLVLVKGGTIPYISLAWSGLTILAAMVLQAVATRHPSFQVVKFWTRPDALARFYLRPLFWLFLLQCWLALQIITGVSRDQQASIDHLLLGIGFLSFLIVLGAIEWNSSKIKQLLFGLIIFASLQAVYGLWVFLTQANVILWMEKVHYLDRPTGTLVNANHFAAYLSLMLILLLAFFVSRQQAKVRHKKSTQVVFNLFEQLYDVYTLCALLFLVAIFATRSLGTIGSLLATFLLAFMIMLLGALQQKLLLKKLCFSVGVFFSILLGIVMLSDYSVLQKELETAAFTIERRVEISSAAVRMVLDNFFFGVGGGGFYSSFSQYRDIDVGNSFYHFAHNDYLQFWAEYGLVGVVLGLLFIGSCLRLNWNVLQQSKNMYKRSFAYASLYGSFLLGLHSFVDFPLRVPAYALLYLLILCFNVVIFNAKKDRQILRGDLESNDMESHDIESNDIEKTDSIEQEGAQQGG